MEVQRRGRVAASLALSALLAGCLATPSPPPASVSPRSFSPPASATPLASPAPAPTATPSQVSPSQVSPSPSSPVPAPTPTPVDLGSEPAAYAGSRFPPGYQGYHTYLQMATEVATVAAAHPDLVDLFSIGRSAQGAQLWAVRVSEDVRDDHGRPEALFDGLHHALEHMSLEMTLAILHWLVDGYGHDAQVTALLRSRAIDIVFAVNPDGAAYDIAGGTFHRWRKNRQATPGSGAIGTDLNRNYDDHWGCCGLVSADPRSPYYRGPNPFSAPETRALAAFVESRVVGGRQRIRVAITFHTSGRLVLWPYGYTRTPVPGDMTADDHAVFVALARAMAASNGYTAEQASGLYVDSGTARDWEYGRQHIFAFTFELGTGLYQPSSSIPSETTRNRAAILYLIGLSDCPYRVIGKEATYCPSLGSATTRGTIAALDVQPSAGLPPEDRRPARA